jgi:hypothetical protein
VQRLKDSPVEQALRKADENSRLFPPKKPVVSLDLPAEYGGRREFNADQIRIMTGWLIAYELGWASQDEQMPRSKNRRDLRQSLLERCSRIAETLDKVRTRD